MFITNAATPAEILAQLIMPAAENIADEFKTHAHNKDLCPKFQDRAELILNAYAKHWSSVDDIQGFTDQGVDVLLRYTDEQGEHHNVGLQVKSYREIEDDLKLESSKRTLTNSLHAQRNRAQSKHHVEMYYIILCGDGGDKHRDFVRRVKSEFTSIDDVRVITPGQAWVFYNLKDYEIAAYCTKVLCADDYILHKVIDAFLGESNEYRRMYIALVVNQLEGSPELHFDDLIDYAAGDKDEYDRDELCEQITRHLENLEFNSVVENIDGENFKLLNNNNDGLCALYFDLRVRHGLTGQNAIKYLWKLTED